ncbi:PAS domain-containing sensor histidine kinase [Sphingomonas sp. RS6]
MVSRPSHDAEAMALLIDATVDRGIMMLDADGAVVSWNRGIELMADATPDQLRGARHDDFYPPADIAEGRPVRDRAEARANGRVTMESWRLRRDGSEFLADVQLTALLRADNTLIGFAEVWRDITDLKATETALEGSALHLRSILATIPTAMIVIDERGIMLSFSAAAERLFGWHEADVIGRNVSMLMPAADAHHHDGYLARYLTTGERRVIGIGRIVMGRRRDGTDFPLELQVGEVVSDGRRIFTGFLRDLTAEQRAEVQLKELQSELLHVSRVSAMGTMASTLAHELNQPLTAVANYVQAGRALVGRDDDPATRTMVSEMLESAGKEVLRAGHIVRRLREFVSRGEVDKSIENLPQLIDEAGRLALIGARERGVSAQYRIDPAAGAVLCDRVQIQQVLVNLIRNAVEAVAESPRRQLTIGTDVAANHMIRIYVADSGPGVDPAIQSRLFQAFASTKEHGMGLGLSICRTIVEAHGGRIWVERAPGGGAMFCFTLLSAQQDEAA